MLRINNLTKIYGDKKAVDNLTLHIQKGEIYGFRLPETLTLPFEPGDLRISQAHREARIPPKAGIETKAFLEMREVCIESSFSIETRLRSTYHTHAVASRRFSQRKQFSFLAYYYVSVTLALNTWSVLLPEKLDCNTDRRCKRLPTYRRDRREVYRHRLRR